MTLETLLAEIDAAAATHIAAWKPVQESYRAQHGRYMQVLLSHSVIPADGAATLPDRLAQAPHYQQESLAAMGFAATPLKAAFSVDQHVGPRGCGWSLRLTVRWQGQLWTRCIGHGAHPHHTNWHALEAVT
jgi:hypothetical protein